MTEIKGFTKSTFLDWDGRIASILFLPGCNLRCPYCHASALVRDPASLPPVAFEEVADYLERNRGWIDGVVITGGEATLDAGLPDLVDRLRALGVAVKLFTNGTRPDVLAELIAGKRLAAVSMDLKAPLDGRYAAAAGVEVDVASIRASISAIMDSGLEYEFRTTVCPAVLRFDDVADLAREVGGARLLILQQFRPVDCLDASFERFKPYAVEELERMARAARDHVARCVVQP